MHVDNISSGIPIMLEVSPVIFENQNQSFYEDTHFEIDNLIAELSVRNYLIEIANNSVCGLLNILRQVALCRGISEKFFTLSAKEINFHFSDYSCFYNAFADAKISCEQCKKKLLKNMPLKLGIFDDMTKEILETTGEKSEFKVLTADWDYIV